jgi:hypothetical protein
MEAAVRGRRDELNSRLDAFLKRATDEGVLRPGLPAGWVAAVVWACQRTAAQEFPQLNAAHAADLAVETVLSAIGAASR